MSAGRGDVRSPAPRVRRAPRRAGAAPAAPPLRGRLGASLLVWLLVLGGLVVQLVQVQAIDAETYASHGESRWQEEVVLTAERGAVFDRNGRELALSIRQRTVWANPRLVTDPLGHAEALAPILGAEVDALRARLSRDAAFTYLARKVPDDVADQVDALGLDGVFLLEEPKRFTPAGDLAAPVLGVVGIDDTGLSGLELLYEGRLAGRPGRLVADHDPAGREIPGGLRTLEPSVPGDDLVLTLDRSIQHEAERALGEQIAETGAKGGIAVVMATKTGELLAMANLVRDEETGEVRPSAANMALTNVYEPGSVNKLITIAAALEEGEVRADSRLQVPPTIRIADKVFSEHDPHPTVSWSITDIMANSSNVGSIMLGQQLGKDRLDRYLRSFGFGSTTGLDFPGESAGILHRPDRWYPTTLGTVSIGQGISSTAVQVLAAFNTIANGGEYVAPKLVKGWVGPDGGERPADPALRRRVVSEATAEQVTGMLDEVVRVGTGMNARIDGYTVAGKTGTARKPKEGARGYEAGAYVSSFAGFVPSEDPALTAIVMLDEPTPIYGGIVAAPVFAEITRYGLRQLRVPPPAPRARPVVPQATPATAAPVGEVDVVPGPAGTLVTPPADRRAPRSAPPTTRTPTSSP